MNRNLIASSHAVSEDGSRVFFEAVPGKACGKPSMCMYVSIMAWKRLILAGTGS